MTLIHTPAHTVSVPDVFVDDESGASFSVFQDTSAEDPRTWIGDDSKVAVYVFNGPHGDKDDETPENIAAHAFRRFYEIYDEIRSLELTKRWLAAFHPEVQYDLTVETIRGHSQSDWAEVFAASIIDRPGAAPSYGTAQSHIAQYAQWRWGDVWVVDPDGTALDPLGGIYADDPEEALRLFLTEHKLQKAA